MWPRRDLIDLLAVEHPIVQAPMASAATPELAAAVADAGAVGSLGSAMLGADVVAAQYERARATSGGVLNLNFFANTPARHDPERNATARELVSPFFEELGLGDVPERADVGTDFDEAMLERVLALRPALVSFHFGLPNPAHVEALKQVGARVISSATTVHEAILLERDGADAIIAQGWEAGGHRGTFASPFAEAQVGTFALVPQVVDAVSVPVIAAGGIGDGRGIAAAFALGASGVQIGTGFLRCPETSIAAAYRDALASGRGDATVVTRAVSGRPARALRNRYVEHALAELGEAEETLPEFPSMMAFQGPLRKASAERGSPEFMALWAGQAAALSAAMPAAELVARLVADAEQAFASLG